ncbi:M20/M25/M40 family metallo-hydrolase [Shouchella clausii]|uniref:M20/M25/M40 family metallo-hydrolase n=1 Tax=Shouchella TaxID=2893057 RepID=UPI000682B9E4|nr:M20/M25/M40 family metallo-hydrolase [Shouchella clausii]MBU3231871.1 M20/M25/M40 family metallo-hydrolase [Shouchella clausii]MBU3264845.1 M20/M25/M40 family metallo-hydrolase [Shouchella clausii]MBU3507692.1 M20/M25/M40 family metallo-hydrolase [Shouchella clausii]MBU3533335.1 M20/M25/M40 family metallo-hydrolase [Shouchella clausii]MBX0307057.1 M20/M25/M40 family metallo-hydrolase [Shouchella clausii]
MEKQRWSDDVYSRVVEEFLELVQIDSETKHEEKMASVLKEKFTSLGLDVVEDDAKERTGHGAGNLICTLPETSSGFDPLYFIAHMDTVGPGKGIQPIVENGYIQTDGTTILGADDKAGIAAMLEATRVLQASKEPHGQIQFVITVGEEAGLVGAKALAKDAISASYGYALDSDGEVGGMITSAPSQAKIFAKVYGKTAHAGVEPEKGISAIAVASKAVSKMPLGRIDADTTANIGRFEGGTQTNIVCDVVTITAEARSLVEEKLKQQVEAMKQAFEQAALEMSTSCDVQVTYSYPGYREPEDTKVVQTAIRAIKACGLTPMTTSSGGGSDANIISGYGIPTINLSVGYEGIHTTSERISIEALENTAKLVVEIARSARK